jgi:DNA-binding transcriptional MerR regulator
MVYTVKAVADLAKLTVRALHHYDHIGLLRPSGVSPAGYRLYGEADLERLQQILFFRELGFCLEDIKAILDSPGFDRREALLAHKRLLLEQRGRLDTLILSVDRSIHALERGIPMDQHTMFEGFDDAKLREYQEEARTRWGSEQVDESIRRASRYTKEDWVAIQAETNEINQTLAARMDGDPADPEVQRQVDRWFHLINDRYYDCSLEVFRGLGDLYVEDSRFTAFYDAVRPGLAQFKRAAMHAYCDRQAGKS